MLPRLTLMAAVLLAGFSAVATDVAADEIVRYRAEKWQAKHIHDDAKAKTISETLSKLGCEVKKAAHNGHVDVKYRCPEWRQMELDTHEEAHKWEKWFKEYGFQTEHKH
ncbi:hypothetical protein Pla22_04110 [Rubripirellula amarantea]|uniref:Uncharacterized protein n=1 Tax=Rubripirellula amarantea TaxID=2527999 RepID=A0A5C5WPK0_9BACT|nr:hypothetical protein [Rubripirellula amarantea]TWT52784.1 hypothetical protein Pla22_04110 [Rubripirellula amarantea]